MMRNFLLIIVGSLCFIFTVKTFVIRGPLSSLLTKRLIRLRSDGNNHLDNLDNEEEIDIDISLIGDDENSNSLAMSIKEMLDGTDKPADNLPSPVDTFNNLYKSIKANHTFDPTQALEMLFNDKPVNHPFDEKKMFTKLRSALGEDFNTLFDPKVVGEFL